MGAFNTASLTLSIPFVGVDRNGIVYTQLSLIEAVGRFNASNKVVPLILCTNTGAKVQIGDVAYLAVSGNNLLVTAYVYNSGTSETVNIDEENIVSDINFKEIDIVLDKSLSYLLGPMQMEE